MHASVQVHMYYTDAATQLATALVDVLSLR